MPGPNPVSLVAKQRHLSLKILRRKIWATAGNEPGSEALRYKNNKKCPLRADGPTRRCLVPRRLSFDENVRAKEGGKETTGFACRLYPSHGPLRFITSHSRFALASAMRKTKRLRRRLYQTYVSNIKVTLFNVA